jgi:hypothetical protein
MGNFVPSNKENKIHSMKKANTISTLVLLAIKSTPIVKREGNTVAARINGGYATVSFPELKEKAIPLNNKVLVNS